MIRGITPPYRVFRVPFFLFVSKSRAKSGREVGAGGALDNVFFSAMLDGMDLDSY